MILPLTASVLPFQEMDKLLLDVHWDELTVVIRHFYIK
jgi:hypothetical protein